MSGTLYGMYGQVGIQAGKLLWENDPFLKLDREYISIQRLREHLHSVEYVLEFLCCSDFITSSPFDFLVETEFVDFEEDAVGVVDGVFFHQQAF